MAIEAITLDDLMRECRIDDPVEFRRILKRNGLPIVSSRGGIPREDASRIVKRLQGRKIDWYQYEAKKRDQFEEGPLKRASHASDVDLIEDWYRQLTADGSALVDHDWIIGIVTRGGFLQGDRGGDFVLNLDAHINVLIGDRGAGKSTALNLIGLLAESVSEETDVLVTRMLNLLNNPLGELHNVNRRARRILHGYGIDRYAAFFNQAGVTGCYSIDLNDKSFDFLQRQENGSWLSATGMTPEVPSMRVLQQGEVIEIADDKHRFFLHNILDGVYPELHARRTACASETQRVITQGEYFEPDYVEVHTESIRSFLGKHRQQLSVLKRDLEERRLSTDAVAIIRNYGTAYSKVDKSLLPKTLDQMLDSNLNSYHYLHLGRTKGFLNWVTRRIVRLHEKQLDPVTELVDPRSAIKSETSSRESTPPSPSLSPTENILDDTEGIEDDSKLFADWIQNETADIESEDPTGLEIFRLLESLTRFLDVRQRVIERWINIFSKRRIRCTGQFTALMASYAQLLEHRIELIRAQEETCVRLTAELNEDELEISIHTTAAERVIEDHKREIIRTNWLPSACDEVYAATPRTPMRVLANAATTYDDVSRNLVMRVEELASTEDLLFYPVDVTLRQGNVYRDFEHLSFGQKSGIILKMVLSTTAKPIILIDQPEDNLDASSVVNMLAPTLSRLGMKRQIVIATHNSHLVMGLTDPHILVLGSLGEHGRCRAHGVTLRNRQLVQHMIDVLEGGLNAFSEKMKLYESFLNRVTGSIDDIDVAAIESSFRRRTIDGLRNFLQPIVSDRSLMDFLRHQLKQPDYAGIHDDIEQTLESIKSVTSDSHRQSDDLSKLLTKLCERLDSHIDKLKGAIEEIRLLDTNPHRKPIDAYSLLTDLANEYLTKLSRTRHIEIVVPCSLKDQVVFVDPDHLRLIFRNLISNALRATEKRVVSEMIQGCSSIQPEIIRMDRIHCSERFLILQFSDNGCGMSEDLRQKLYVERCSDQKGSDHGLGGVIIRKLLELSGGSIRVLETRSLGVSLGTVQEITLPLIRKTAN